MPDVSHVGLLQLCWAASKGQTGSSSWHGCSPPSSCLALPWSTVNPSSSQLTRPMATSTYASALLLCVVSSYLSSHL